MAAPKIRESRRVPANALPGKSSPMARRVRDTHAAEASLPD
jgi:hypothetical protein